MQGASLSLRLLAASVAGTAALAAAPAARGDDGLTASYDPAAAALALADAAVAGVPIDPEAVAAEVSAVVPPAEPLPAVEVATPEAVTAAAAEPNPAMEPHPSPPPPQPEAVAPAPVEPSPEPVAVSPAAVVEPAPAAAFEPAQYQPAPSQYQPAVSSSEPADALPVPATPEKEWSWDWTWSCGGSKPSVPPLPSGEGLPKNWTWNWDWNCGSRKAQVANSNQNSGGQYHSVIARYQPLNLNVSIRIGSPGDDGPVTQTSVIVAVEAGAAATAGAVAAPPAPAAAPAPEERTSPAAAAPRDEPDDGAKPAPAKTPSADDEPRRPLVARAISAGSSWAAPPPRVSKRLQPATPEADRSRPQLRRPTRRPSLPRRAPQIPVSSAGASPLGGSDGGGFQIALLLVPLALALVDSVRRSVRDITPPVERAHRSRRERPG